MKSKNPLFYSTVPPEAVPEIGHTSFVSNKQTGTIEWILSPKHHDAQPELDIHDRRELAKTNLKDLLYFAKAKRIYAAHGGINDIRAGCGNSLSYAQKVHAALEKAVKSRNSKK